MTGPAWRSESHHIINSAPYGLQRCIAMVWHLYFSSKHHTRFTSWHFSKFRYTVDMVCHRNTPTPIRLVREQKQASHSILNSQRITQKKFHLSSTIQFFYPTPKIQNLGKNRLFVKLCQSGNSKWSSFIGWLYPFLSV